MTRKTLTEQSTLYSGARGSVVITRLAPGHILVTLYGYNDGELGSTYIAALENEMDSAGSLVVYMDSREQTGISSAERDRLSEWTKKHMETRYRAGHLLFRSRLLEMALAVARLVTGHALYGYSDTKEFEEIIAREVPGFLRLPSFPRHADASPLASARP